jgi:ankyrin repeat protein
VRVLWIALVVACQATPTRAPAVAPVAAPAPPIVTATGLDAMDESGWTALGNAAEAGDLAKINALLASGASIDAEASRTYHGPALVVALEFDKSEAAKLLLDRGASIAGRIGTDALELAARSGTDAIIETLLARGVSPNGTRAVAAAAKFGHVAAIARLVRAGAAIDAPDADDHHFTPLMVACMEGQLEAARDLIADGANVNARDDEHFTALHWAVFASRPDEIHIYRELDKPHDTVRVPHKDAPLVALLVARGAKLEATTTDGNTPLHEAAMLDARAAAQVLVAAGADRAARNGDHKTALELAKDRHNSVEAVLAP